MSSSEEELASCFKKGLFEKDNVKSVKSRYADSEPYKHAILSELFDPEFLLKARQDVFKANFTDKETDIYRINQTGDLGNIHLLPEDEMKEFSNLLKLRNALYSSTFRQFLRDVTGCGPLSGVKTDMSCANYSLGCHLLNHDDVIGTRRVSFILYIPIPEPGWKPEYGGALELYPLSDPPTDPTTPAPKPSASYPPSFNQFAFFEVQPGHSFHSVEEVVVQTYGDNSPGAHGQRISISGWFHAPVEGEPDYEGPAKNPQKSSLQQLYDTALKPLSQYESDPPMPLPETLKKDEINYLSKLLNPAYLKPKTIRQLRKRFVDDSVVMLAEFLKQDIAHELEELINKRDKSDKLLLADRETLSKNKKERIFTIPPHSTGEANGWKLIGPPHLQRFATLDQSSKDSGRLEELIGSISELLTSEAFRSFLCIITCIAPLSHSIEPRRFRPGLDYTLARGDPNDEPKLDIGLNLTPDSENEEDEHAFENGQVGGWDIWLANEDDTDEATYGAGAGDDEDDGPLLTLPPEFNRLHLVLRDAGVLRFVKYLSSRAPQARWDITGEYDVGQLEEDDDDEEEEDDN